MLSENDFATGQLVGTVVDGDLDRRARFVGTLDLVGDGVDPAHRRYPVFDRETLRQDELMWQAQETVQ